jgi:type I restriction enzyme S subunit
LPPEWSQEELGDHFEITSSKRVFQKDWRTTGVPFYRARELAVLTETGRVDNELFIERSMFEEYKMKFGAPQPGDFLVTGVGTLGKSYVVKDGDEFYFKDGNIIWLKRSGTIDSEFLHQLFRSPIVMEQILGGSSGTTVGTYTITNAKKTKIPVPPLNEQRAIAAALSETDDLTASLESLIAKKRDIKQAVMQQLLTGRTRLPGFEGEWEEQPLSDVLTVRHGRSQQGIEDPQGRYPILATGGEIGRTNTPIHNGPSVLIGRKGTIDRPQYRDEPFWTVDTLFYTEVEDDANAKFLFYRFQLIDWKSMNEASGVPSLSSSRIESLPILLPGRAEQDEIATVLSDMDAEIEALEARLAKTRDIKVGMMQELLTGRTRLPIPEGSEKVSDEHGCSETISDESDSEDRDAESPEVEEALA